jgi:serine/threonine-protein kinase
LVDHRAYPVREPAPASGLRLGYYRLIEPLGGGCQAQVWRALQVGPIVADVALKLLSPEQARIPGWKSQFHREAQWGAQLSSPWLLPTYEFGASAGYLYFAMPLVEGDSLADIIARRQRRGNRCLTSGRHWVDRLEPMEYVRQIVAIIERVARGAAAAHASGVVHCDIKPANILVDRQSSEGVYLVDFGLGRDLDDPLAAPLADSNGTPLYMAPERFLGQTAHDRLCDIYSLGITLSEAVSLMPPFSVPESVPSVDWAAYLALKTPRRARDEVPGVSPTLERLIHRATSRIPTERHPSMTALAEDLNGLFRAEVRDHAR